jgi:putative N-acetylmannosamine-6-phosphate epimerase
LTPPKKYFAGFEDHYVIIGGTACDIVLRDADMRPRATDDTGKIVSQHERKHQKFYQHDGTISAQPVFAGQFTTNRCGNTRISGYNERYIRVD